jgi:hypothetical protein
LAEYRLSTGVAEKHAQSVIFDATRLRVTVKPGANQVRIAMTWKFGAAADFCLQRKLLRHYRHLTSFNGG